MPGPIWNAHGNLVDKQFKDLYKLLEEVQGSIRRIECIAKTITRCYREIRSLERVHRNKWRFSDGVQAEDPFELRGILQDFYNTCHSLKYVTLPNEDDDKPADIGCFTPSKPSGRGWRKKQVKAIESDLLDHERTIALVLSSIVYSTTLKISRRASTSDTTVSYVLSCAERRHEVYERKQQSSTRSAQDAILRPEEAGWELCVQKYFKLLDTWCFDTAETSLPSSRAAVSRTSSLTPSESSHALSARQSRPPISNDTRFSTYSNFRRGEEAETNSYFRQPRRASSTLSLNLLAAHNRPELSRQSTVDPAALQSQELVLYEPRCSSSSSSVVTARPIRRSSIRGDFHWEYIGRSSTFNMLQPLTTRWPELKDAQADIYNQTQGMSSAEARAYALGRLAGLSPEITDEVRRVLSMSPTSQVQPQIMAPHASKMIQSAPGRHSPTETRRRSMTLETLPNRDMAMKAIMGPNPSTPLLQQQARSSHMTTKTKLTKQKPSPTAPVLTVRNNPPPPKRGLLSALTDRRPMTAISERSAKSGFSKYSMDKSPGRSILQGFKPRKRAASQLSTLETVPDKVESSGGYSSSGSDTLISSSNSDIKERPASAHSQDTITTSSTMNIAERTPSRSRINYRPKIIAAFFGAGSRKDESHLDIPIARVAGAQHNTAGISQESFKRMSAELLSRRDSRLTILSISDNMDIPYDMWLRALPYIEGRCASPFVET